MMMKIYRDVNSALNRSRGTLGLLANLGVAALLFAHRAGNGNMRSVWLCTRNDAIGNIAVLIAAAGVFRSGSA